MPATVDLSELIVMADNSLNSFISTPQAYLMIVGRKNRSYSDTQALYALVTECLSLVALHIPYEWHIIDNQQRESDIVCRHRQGIWQLTNQLLAVEQ